MRLRNAVAVAVLVVLCLSPTAAGGGAATTADGALGVTSLTIGDDPLTSIFAASSDSIAEIAVFVPPGFTLDLGRPAGTEIGEAFLTVGDPASSGFGDFADGRLVVDDPAKYAGDPVAQACAPGTHAAVWRASLEAGRRTLELSIFVDPTLPDGPAGIGHVLTACPVWPSTEVGVAHRVADSFGLFLEGVVRQPTGSGTHTWHALVTPAGPASVTAEPSRTFELRAIVPLPRTLTLRAKHDARSKTVVLSGRLLTLGKPDAGAMIEFGEINHVTEDFSSFGPVRTNAAGAFSIRRHVEHTTEYRAQVQSEPRPCSGTSTAPGGCVSETVTPPLPAGAGVVVRKRTAAKLVVRRADLALARRAVLKAADFPPGWDTVPLVIPPEVCSGFTPNLSALTATGEARSHVFLEAAGTGVAFSNAAVYSTAAHARTAFGKQAVRQVADCVADESRDSDTTILTIAEIPFPKLGQQTRAFRVVGQDEEGTWWADLVSFRRGRVVVHLVFSSLGAPLAIERRLAAKVYARARGS